AKEWLPARESARFEDDGRDGAMALVDAAGTALGLGSVGILHRCGAAGGDGVLPVVDGFRPGIGSTELQSLAQVTIERDSRAVVDAGGGCLVNVNGSELRDRAVD